MSLGLESLNLNDQESKLYIILLANGPQSLGELIKNTEFSSAEIIKAIEVLKKNDYAFDIPGIATRYHAVLPFKDLKNAGENTITELKALASQIDDHTAKKLENILTTMRDESTRMNESISDGQQSIEQFETNSQTEMEESTAKTVLEIEQVNEENKKNIGELIKQKQSEHQELLSGIGTSFEQNADGFQDKYQEIRTALETKNLEDLSSLKTEENERNTGLLGSFETLTTDQSTKLSQGFETIQSTVESTGEIMISSIDTQRETLNNFVTKATSEVSNAVQNTSSQGKQFVKDSLNIFQEDFNQNLEAKKESAINIFQSSRDQFTNKTAESTQSIKDSVNEILSTAQKQISDMVQNIHESLNEKINSAKSQVEDSMGNYSESLKQQVESDFEKVITDTTGTLTDLVVNAKTTYEKAVTDIENHYTQFDTDTNSKINSLKESSLNNLKETIESLKKEVQKHVSEFSVAVKPHELSLMEELSRFKTEFSNSQNESLSKFTDTIDSFKDEVTVKNQELSSLIQNEMNELKQGIQRSISEMNSLVQSYDEKYSTTLIDTTTKASEALISKTRQLQEKTMTSINSMSKSATQKLGEVSEVLSTGIQNEISTLETELKDFSAKFQEVSKKNEETLKNYLFSLEKLTSLVTDTKHPEVQTAPIVSKQATLTFIEGMFDRLKGGITLLIPFIKDIPVDLILATKNHQRVNLVTMIDKEAHLDLLKKLLQKPNVRVRQIDSHKFEGVEGYLAADRDAEEVIIAVKEDNGETIGIASQADSFIVLMGKIVLGDYFLARSTEITRAEVGV